MSDFVKMEDFRQPDKSIDWTAYNKAQEANGERCWRCHGVLIFHRGYPEECPECCRMAQSPEETSHKKFVRCPKCRELFNPVGDEFYEAYQEGPHNVQCPECDQEFEIETYVSYSWKSPSLLKEAPDAGAKPPAEEVPQDGGEDPAPGQGP